MTAPRTITELHDETLRALLPSDAGNSQQVDMSQSFYAGAAAVVFLLQQWKDEPNQRQLYMALIEEMQASQFSRSLMLNPHCN